MNRKLVLLAATLAVLSVLLAADAVRGRRMERQATLPSVEQGRHLVDILGCHDCHTPFKMGPNGPESDMSRMLSGHPETLVMPEPTLPTDGAWAFVGAATNTAFAGPWGITYTANLTPDEATGLGIWTEEMFVKAIREGRHMGQSRPLQPPMPWMWFAKMTDQELRSVYAYLRTVPAIHNRVPEYRPPGPPVDPDGWEEEEEEATASR